VGQNIEIQQGDARDLIKQVEANSISTIYFDPPFNTGKKYRLDTREDSPGFDDIFVNDQEYIELIEPILIEAKRVLKKDGSLFFHISAEEMLIPNLLCSKHFNIHNVIVWNRSRSKNNVKNKLGSVVDMIFWCSNSKKPKYNMAYQPLDAYYAENSYKNQDDRGFYALGHIVYTKTQKTENKERLYKIKIGQREFEPENGWRVSEEELKRLLSEDRIHISKKEGSNLYRKIYKHESKGKPCTNLWDDIHSIAMGSEGRKYPTQKPTSLLERIILMSSDEGDIILDPMAGAGTAGAAALNLNRKAILFEQNPEAIDIMRSKLST